MEASVFIATSLDGFIARPDDNLDWLPAGGGEEHGYEAFMSTVDALVVGRRMEFASTSFSTVGGRTQFRLPVRAGAIMVQR